MLILGGIIAEDLAEKATETVVNLAEEAKRSTS
jgi:hypothetical protein